MSTRNPNRKVLATLLLGCAVSSAMAQIERPMSLLYPVQGQQSVSKNQLLTPTKALKAAKRAGDEFIRGHFDLAQREVDRALTIAPKCAMALTMQGALDLQKGQDEAAAARFQESIGDDPSLAAAYVGLALIHISHGRFKDALAPLDRAAGLLPGSWFIQFQRAAVEVGVGDYERALKQLKIASGLTGGIPERESGVSYLHALISLKVESASVARQYLASAVAIDPNGAYASLSQRALDSLASTYPTHPIDTRASE